MATQANKKDSRKVSPGQVGIGVVIAALVLLVIALSVEGHHYLAASSQSPLETMVKQNPFPSWVVADSKQCGGDFSKLPAAEQQKLNAQYKGSAGMVIHIAHDNAQ
jgi:hypothetical protein